ncbi:MAG: hypothetical protein MI747_24015 [Desulfobacterales bacterium]|nr:hypothetical protein [Desulfobacterales bacterium]
MILHDFVHEWDGKSNTGEKPITWWPGAYRIRIVGLGPEKGKVLSLIPKAVIFKSLQIDGSMNTALKNYIDNFAKNIAQHYGLNIDKTLWVEWDAHPLVAQLKPERRLGNETLYSISWRPIRPNEQDMLRPYTKDF